MIDELERTPRNFYGMIKDFMSWIRTTTVLLNMLVTYGVFLAYDGKTAILDMGKSRCIDRIKEINPNLIQ